MIICLFRALGRVQFDSRNWIEPTQGPEALRPWAGGAAQGCGPPGPSVGLHLILESNGGPPKGLGGSGGWRAVMVGWRCAPPGPWATLHLILGTRRSPAKGHAPLWAPGRHSIWFPESDKAPPRGMQLRPPKAATLRAPGDAPSDSQNQKEPCPGA